MRQRFQSDLLCIAALLAIAAPLYLYKIYTVPWQINTDEITIMIFFRRYAEAGFFNLWEPSTYFNFPAFIFIIFGWLGNLVDGIDLLHMRVVHALSGLLIIAVSFLFFRRGLSRGYAFAGALVLGLNHSLFAISRMAMRDNTGLLFELVALLLLVTGLQKNSRAVSFIGGLATALTFYTYYPSRITIFLWAFFLILAGIFLEQKYSWRTLLTHFALTITGFFLLATPILYTTSQLPRASNHYAREQILLYPEGRKLEMDWTGTKTESEAVKKNIINGLTTFNNRIHDQGYIYPNEGHGFVDPLTGVLIWLGVGATLFAYFKKKERSELAVLCTASLISLWLIFSFLITKAPNYTRLLITLPFVAYLAVHGLQLIASLSGIIINGLAGFFAEWGMKRAGLWRVQNWYGKKDEALPVVSKIMFGVGVFIILAFNVAIFADFAEKGLREGNDVGSTGRYIEARNEIPGYSFHVVADARTYYYSWGTAAQWQSWAEFFAGENQYVSIVEPQGVLENINSPPFTLFMNKNLFRQVENSLKARYPNLEVHIMKSDGSLVTVEVQ